METFIKIYLIWQIIGFGALFSVLYNYCYDRWISVWISKFIDYIDEKIF